MNNEEQTKAKMATLGQEMKNLRSELQEHRSKAVERNLRTKLDLNQKKYKTQHDSATRAAQTDIPQVGAARIYEIMN